MAFAQESACLSVPGWGKVLSPGGSLKHPSTESVPLLNCKRPQSWPFGAPPHPERTPSSCLPSPRSSRRSRPELGGSEGSGMNGVSSQESAKPARRIQGLQSAGALQGAG